MKKILRYCIFFSITNFVSCYAMIVKSKQEQQGHCISWNDGLQVLSSDKQGYLYWTNLERGAALKSKKSINNIAFLVKIPSTNKVLIVYQKNKIALALLHDDEIEVSPYLNSCMNEAIFQEKVSAVYISANGKQVALVYEKKESSNEYVELISHSSADGLKRYCNVIKLIDKPKLIYFNSEYLVVEFGNGLSIYYDVFSGYIYKTILKNDARI